MYVSVYTYVFACICIAYAYWGSFQEFSHNLQLALGLTRMVTKFKRFDVTLPGFEKVFFSTSKNVTIFLELLQM